MLKTIYLDMDGVLDDFDKHADELELWREDIHKIDWKKLNAIGSKFWAEIEPFENGLQMYHKLLELCQEHNISLKILSAGPGAKCRSGKIEWLNKYCPEIPIENIIIKNKGIEKAQEAYDDETAAKLEKKLRKNQFTLDDFLDQMGQMSKMGGLGAMLDMIPGLSQAQKRSVDLEKSEKEFAQMKAIIQSMTKKEREDPNILNASRRKRIAAGSGQTVNKVNNLIKRYDDAKKMMKRLNNPKAAKGMFRGMF